MTTIAPPDLRTESKVLLMHRLVFPEVLIAKIPVVDLQGKLWGGPDRRGMNAPNVDTCFMHWQRQVKLAAQMPGTVPAEVMAYFQATKALGRAPRQEEEDVQIFPRGTEVTKEMLALGNEPFQIEGRGGTFYPAGAAHKEAMQTELTITQEDTLFDLAPAALRPKKKLANPPRFATSYSGMKDFLNCPCKWAAAKYFKTLPYIEGPEAAWGNRVHKAFERAVGTIIGYKGERVTEEDLKIIRENGWAQFLKAVVAAWKAGAVVNVEEELCFTKELKPCGWKDWNTVWFRFKGDVHVIKASKFTYIDWKSGKRFSKRGDDQADLFQLEVAWAVVALHRPEIQEFTGKLIFLQEKDLARAVVGIKLTRDDLPRIWEKIFSITGRMEDAWVTENFRMQTSGLCKKHCGNTECAHCGS